MRAELKSGGGLFREVASVHLAYGRWSATTNLVIFLSAQAMVLLVAGVVSLESSGLLRAILNLITPMHLVIAAVATLLIPALSGSGPGRASRLVTRSTLVLACAAAVYAVVLGLFQRPLFALLYGDQYQPQGHQVWILAGTLIAAAAADVAAAALRARERPDLVFRAYVLAALLAMAGGAVLTIWLGLTGAIVAMALSSIVAAAALWRARPLRPVTSQ
jgi:O-antigen/teichoic acid export membrane protein